MEKKTYTKEQKNHRCKRHILRTNKAIYKTEVMALMDKKDQNYYFNSVFFEWTRMTNWNIPFPDQEYHNLNSNPRLISSLVNKIRTEFLKKNPDVICVISAPEKFTTTSKIDKSSITIQLCVPLPKKIKQTPKNILAKPYFNLFKHIIDDLDEIIDSRFNQ